MEINRPKRPWIIDSTKKEGKWQTHEDNKFYHTPAWRKLRKVFIMRHPICEECKINGTITPAKVVDHILSIRLGGPELEWTNLQSLCVSCHNKKSSKESRL